MSLSRAEAVDQNFTKLVSSGQLPEAKTHVSAEAVTLSPAEIVDLFETQVMSRHLDYAARALKTRNESFYTIGSAGHEGNAVFGKAFRYTDMAFLHYRSGALFIQRSKQLPGSTPLYDMLLSLVASADDPISGGRHKVFGSKPLFVPPQTSTIASHLPKAVGAAISIRRSQDLGIDSEMPRDAIILCNFGDASHNHASSLAAFNTASVAAFQNVPVPIVFICEDNGIGISVPTPPDWIRTAKGHDPVIRYFSCDGRHLLDTWRIAEAAVEYTRRTRKPAFLHMKTVRLFGHAGSDVESLYNPVPQIERAERDDPLLHSARILLENGILSAEAIKNLYETMRRRVARIGEETIPRPKLLLPHEVMASLVPTKTRGAPPIPSEEKRQKTFGSDAKYMDKPQHLAKLLNWGLADVLLRYQNAVVFGEDVAQKGGVYHVTAGLWQKFGLRRVFNSPLDETSILGNAIGFAHNGFVPIPEIQFLAYVHNAEDQLRGEASTLSFFSEGRYTNGMVVRVAGLAYQKGFGGHFHNDNSLAVFRDIPGIVIACPSNGADAVAMLRSCVRAAHESGRVVVFIEPIALYMAKDLHEPGDGGWSFMYPAAHEEIPIGKIAVYGGSSSKGKKERLTIVSYGNGFYLSRQAARELEEKHGIAPKIIDLRWLAPLDEAALARECEGSEAILVVDECRRTGSQSEAIMTALVERLDPLPRLKRITAEDCFIPLGRAATVLLPSKESILAAALDVLGLGAAKPKKGTQAKVLAK